MSLSHFPRNVVSEAREPHRGSTTPLRYWIGFNRIAGVGPVRTRMLLDFFDNDLAAAWHADAWSLQRTGLDRRTIASIVRSRPEIDLEAEVARVERYGVQVLTWADEAYPRLLRRIPGSPPVLYLRGTLAAEDEWAVALVGTRHVTTYGRQVTSTLAAGLVEAGLTVVSGLALGVDRIAHESALNAGGRTIAVLANGVERAYPARNRKLAERIVASGQGVLLSDYPLGTVPEASNFPPRNRIISGLSLATIVTEAGARSGALITANNALEQGRDVFAVPGSIFSKASKGTNQLLNDGAAPALSVQAVLQALDIQMAEPQKVVRQVVETTPSEAEVLALLTDTPQHIDELGPRCALPPAQLSGTLALLELKGLVRLVGPMSYIRQ